MANICEKPNGKLTLTYIGGQKANPEDAINITAMVEERIGYVAEDGDITNIVTGATFSMVKNANTISKQKVMYVVNFLKKYAKRDSRSMNFSFNKV